MAVYHRLTRDLHETTQSRALFDLKSNVGLSGHRSTGSEPAPAPSSSTAPRARRTRAGSTASRRSPPSGTASSSRSSGDWAGVRTPHPDGPASGSYIFSRYMSKWTYRSALFFSTIMNTATCFLDIVQYQRWNLLVGLPDCVFMLGKASVQNTFGMINFMPTTILISKVCPHGIEASVYALLAGFSNFGRTIAGYLGAYALTLVGMDHIGTGEVDDFSNAWKV